MENEKAFSSIEFGTKKILVGLLAIPNHVAGVAIVVVVAFVIVVVVAVTIAEAAIAVVAIAAEQASVRKICVQRMQT